MPYSSVPQSTTEEVRAGTRRQEMKQKPARNTAHCLYPHGLLSLHHIHSVINFPVIAVAKVKLTGGVVLLRVYSILTFPKIQIICNNYVWNLGYNI